MLAQLLGQGGAEVAAGYGHHAAGAMEIGDLPGPPIGGLPHGYRTDAVAECVSPQFEEEDPLQV